MSFVIKGTVSKENIPVSKRGAAHDLAPLFDKFDRISDGNSVHVVVTEKHHVATIKTAFHRKYGSSKVTVTQRTQKDTKDIDVYIIRN